MVEEKTLLTSVDYGYLERQGIEVPKDLNKEYIPDFSGPLNNSEVLKSIIERMTETLGSDNSYFKHKLIHVKGTDALRHAVIFTRDINGRGGDTIKGEYAVDYTNTGLNDVPVEELYGRKVLELLCKLDKEILYGDSRNIEKHQNFFERLEIMIDSLVEPIVEPIKKSNNE